MFSASRIINKLTKIIRDSNLIRSHITMQLKAIQFWWKIFEALASIFCIYAKKMKGFFGCKTMLEE